MNELIEFSSVWGGVILFLAPIIFYELKIRVLKKHYMKEIYAERDHSWRILRANGKLKRKLAP